MLIAEDVAAFIEREGLLVPGQRVVAAVSGGADSLCLLDCLDRLGFRVCVAHFDHGLRRESRRDAEFVLREARRRSLPAIVERGSPDEWRRPGRSLEEAAREARYAFLVRAARQRRASAIATGHTADDQSETILMHLLRGAGIHGLRGMLPRTPLDTWPDLPRASGIVLVRPLLATRRSQTEAHCRSAGLRPRWDSTNDDLSFFRNRLRHELLPNLERYNPRVREGLGRIGELMRGEAELLDEILDAVEPAVLRSGGIGTVAFARGAFLAQPVALQRTLVARAASRLAPNLRDFGFEAIEAARARLEQRAVGRRTSLPGGLELRDQGDLVLLVAAGTEPGFPGFPQLASVEAISVSLPAYVPLRDGALVLSVADELPAELGRRQPAKLELTRNAWLDGSRLESDLVVRPPRPGDRMQPLGMQGHRKLAEIFNGIGIPAGARARWPVLTSGDTVVWLAGLRIAHDVRLTARTRQAVLLRVDMAERESG